MNFDVGLLFVCHTFTKTNENVQKICWKHLDTILNSSHQMIKLKIEDEMKEEKKIHTKKIPISNR